MNELFSPAGLASQVLSYRDQTSLNLTQQDNTPEQDSERWPNTLNFVPPNEVNEDY